MAGPHKGAQRIKQKYMENTITKIEIGLSKEDQARIEALHAARKPAKKQDLAGIFKQVNDFVVKFSSVKLKEKVTFFQLLAVMINAGVPIIRSLYILSEQTKNPLLQQTIRDLAKKMEEGGSLSVAMAEHEKIFSESERGMIASGEASGNLNEILKDLAHQAEKSAGIVAKVKGAMAYPIAIVLIMIVALFLMLTIVVPQLTSIFTDSGKELPTATKILIGMSDLAENNWLEVLIMAVAVIGGLVIFKRTKAGKYAFDLLLINLPIFGSLIKKLMISRFARLLASLLKSGVPIVKALTITSKAIGNEVYKKRIEYAAQDVTQGIPLGENLSESSGLFPPMVANMILVGEKTANIIEVSNKIADFYEEEVDNAVSTLSKLMEPVILVVMGASVGFIVAAIMQPIIALSDVSSSI